MRYLNPVLRLMARRGQWADRPLTSPKHDLKTGVYPCGQFVLWTVPRRTLFLGLASGYNATTLANQLTMCRNVSSASSSKFKPQRGRVTAAPAGLYTGERRFKTDPVFAALGNNDELTSWLGSARGLAVQQGFFHLADHLFQAQCNLQDLSSCVATPPTTAKKHHMERTSFDGNLALALSQAVDFYASQTPPLKQFILPGGDELSSRLHICRSVCRRAERSLAAVLLSELHSREHDLQPADAERGEPDGVEKEQHPLQACLRYLNRLSDLLFVMARYVTHQTGVKEMVYLRGGGVK